MSDPTFEYRVDVVELPPDATITPASDASAAGEVLASSLTEWSADGWELVALQVGTPAASRATLRGYAVLKRPFVAPELRVLERVFGRTPDGRTTKRTPLMLTPTCRALIRLLRDHTGVGTDTDVVELAVRAYAKTAQLDVPEDPEALEEYDHFDV
jgi:hypothetical protein